MPRLAPDGDRCREQRITTGTAERKMLALMIRENQKDRIQKYVSSFAMPISVLGLGVCIVGAGYFMAPSIIQDAKEKLEDIKEIVKDTVNKSAGKNPDQSYATILCVGYADSRQWDGTGTSPNEGRVIVNWGSGVPIFGGITGGLLYVGSWISNYTSGGNSEEWVGIVGNYNKDAKRVEDLSEGWYYMNPQTGGAQY